MQVLGEGCPCGAGAGRFTLEVQGHRGVDALRSRHTEQVDVQQPLAHRVALDLLHHNEVFLATHLYRHRARLPDDPQRVHEVVRVGLQRERRPPGSVDVDGGDAGAPERFHFLAERYALLCRDLYFVHDAPSINVPRSSTGLTTDDSRPGCLLLPPAGFDAKPCGGDLYIRIGR